MPDNQCRAKTSGGTRCQNPAQEGSDYCHIPSHSKSSASDLSPKQDRFCQLFVSEEFFGNGTQSYAEAYDIDLSTNYNTAKSAANRLLTKVYICDRINELLEEAGLNDNFVDKQLLMMITQNADFTNKMAAIREYNKLKQRITNKVDHTTGGEKITGIQFVPINESED